MASAKKAPVKKATTKATTNTAPIWNTIHIFGYGESQVIGKEKNGKVPNSELKTIEPLLSYLAGIQQKGTKVKRDDLHALNILNNAFIDFIPKSRENKHQRFAWNELDIKQIDKFTTDVLDKVSKQKPRENIMDRLKKRNKLIKANNVQMTTVPIVIKPNKRAAASNKK